jgi:hypothetical protein
VPYTANSRTQTVRASRAPRISEWRGVTFAVFAMTALLGSAVGMLDGLAYAQEATPPATDADVVMSGRDATSDARSFAQHASAEYAIAA